MSEGTLSSSIQSIKGVGPKLSKLLEKKGIKTLEDALYFVPRAYEDRRRIQTVSQLVPNVAATLRGRVLDSKSIRQRRGQRFEVTFGDKTGQILLVWFHAFSSLEKDFSEGNELLIHGALTLYGSRKQIVHPDYELIRELEGDRPRVSLNFGRIVPIYSETEGLHQKALRRIMGHTVRTCEPELKDALPEELRKRLNFPTLKKSFTDVHFPEDLPTEAGALSKSLQRIIFEEFFVLQLGLGLNKQERAKVKGIPFPDDQKIVDNFIGRLPFALTQDQKKALDQVVIDLARPRPMTRLIQGDVGSGKTVVALAAAAIVAKAGYQVAFMVPTEILAIQHFKTASQWFEPLGIRVSLFTQGLPNKKELLREMSEGKASVIVGTHALFQQKIAFEKLGLVIIDEQHRFGVEQRTQLLQKANPTPHLMMTTATPIPRTLALTLYGDLDLSVIREKPAHRKPIQTRIIRAADRPALYQEIRRTVDRGEQVYVIYPLVEASDKLELKSATEEYQRLSREIFPQYKMALLHGRLASEEKEAILKAFRAGETQVLVSTTVIEVGIDVPRATLMAIEHPERLGLSQLHQLRGRVGRGEAASQCLLVADFEASRRLKVMVDTDDGFEIAEADLQIRGPGEFLGTQQSGLPGFRVGHLLRDSSLLELAKTEAENILAKDPELKASEHAAIRKLVDSRWGFKISRLRSG